MRWRDIYTIIYRALHTMNKYYLIIGLLMISSKLIAEELTYDIYDHEESAIQVTFDYERNTGFFSKYDVIHPLETCSEKEIYLCFTSIFWNFAIPKNFRTKKIEEWTYRGHKYNLAKSNKEIFVFGRKMIVDVITNKIKFDDGYSGVQYYYFSHYYGLVSFGFKRSKEDFGSSYFLQEACGFGASSGCSKLNSKM